MLYVSSTITGFKMDIVWNVIVKVIFWSDFLSAMNVKLEGPKYATRDQTIDLSCSADSPPVGRRAEFLSQNSTIFSVRQTGSECYKGDIKCTRNSCGCSENGHEYYARLDILYWLKELQIGCLMKFKTGDLFRNILDTLTIRIIDLTGPIITLDKEFPLIAGTTVRMTCTVTTDLMDMNMTWDCPGIQEEHLEQYNATSYYSTFYMAVSSTYNGKQCLCLIQKESFRKSNSIVLDVISSPIVDVDSTLLCNKSSTVQLTCVISGELLEYGFDPWIHAFNKTYIRTLSGKTDGNISQLCIKSCTYEDAGEYMCTAWNNVTGKMFRANKTSEIRVNGPPVILSTDQQRAPVIVLSIQYHSLSKLLNPKWYRHDEDLNNSAYTTHPLQIELDMYGKVVSIRGYNTALTLHDKTGGTYTVVLENKFGKSTYDFFVKSGGSMFNFQYVLWTLIFITVFIVAVVLTAFIASYRSGKNITVQTGSGRSSQRNKIYYAAPPIETDIHTYNITDPHYNDVTFDPNSRSSDQFDESSKDGSDSEENPHIYLEILT